MDLKPYDYRDPGELVQELAHRDLLGEEAAYLAIVEAPSTHQRLVALDRLDSPARLEDYEPARDELRRRLEQADLPQHDPAARSGPRHSATVLVVRRGLCVPAPNEGRWASAWRYVNTFANTYTGGLILVTEHGWTDLDSGCAARTPALACDLLNPTPAAPRWH